MTKQEKRKGGGAKLSRSETVTVRLDPKLRYIAELASLRHRRTLSSFIEWAVEQTLKGVYLRHSENAFEDVSLASEAESLWDVDEADRFAKLALRYPELLNHEEQKRWKLIRENGWLWRGAYRGTANRWTWEIKEVDFCFDRLREKWELFCAVARGEEIPAKLPTWTDKKAPEQPIQKPSASPPVDKGFEDDDIPF